MSIHNPVTSYGVNSSGDSEAQLVIAVTDGSNPVTAVTGGGNLVTLTTSGINPVTFIGGTGSLPANAIVSNRTQEPIVSNLTQTQITGNT